ncbi:MAG: phage head closure protein [Reyranella sp.]|nr:phage head closure protein [Reyranella sp.]
MRAGDLDRRITIERFTETQGPSGEPILEWNALATVWAKVDQQGGREFFASIQEVSERKVVFRIRWIEGLTVLDRVVCDGDLHDIEEVRRLGRKEGLELHCTAS